MSERSSAYSIEEIREVAARFPFEGVFVDARPHGCGHINDTFVLTYDTGGMCRRYLLQRINRAVFPDVPQVMKNIIRVTQHLAAKLERQNVPDLARRVLTVIPTWNRQAYHIDEKGHPWRSYLFIEGVVGHERISSTRQAYEVAFAFGAFQRDLIDLPGGRLHETIREFHHTRNRFEAFRTALAEDRCERAKTASAEIAFYLEREPIGDILLDLLASGALQERITHNDAKLNNVLVDAATGAALCVADLDTVMPGLALYDFGDLVRTSTSSALEDERDTSLVRMQMPMFAALVEGYIASAGEFLSETEIAHMAFAGKLITFEIGLRFLTDYLQGDIYYKTRRPEHNLDRTRTQMALVRSIEEQEDEMQRVVNAAIHTARRLSAEALSAF